MIHVDIFWRSEKSSQGFNPVAAATQSFTSEENMERCVARWLGSRVWIRRDREDGPLITVFDWLLVHHITVRRDEDTPPPIPRPDPNAYQGGI